MKTGQLIEYTKKKIFFRKHVENELEKLVPDLFLFFKKALYEVKSSGQHFSFNTFRYPSTWHTLKSNCIKL